MMNGGKFRKNMSLFLMLGIVVLCAGFFIVSCGTKPQKKVETITGGAFGIDLSDCPAPGGNPCYAVVDSDVFKKDPNKTMAGKELTVEAWVKLHSTSTSGAIFGRLDSSGIMLYIKSGVPKAIVRRVTGPSGSTSTINMFVNTGGAKLMLEAWTHLAAVLSFPNSSSSKLDLYVNGQLKNSQNLDENGDAVARSEYTEPGGNYLNAGAHLDGPIVDGIAAATILNARIDETRLWGVARTQPEIQKCMGEELSLDGSTCGRETKNLIGYFRFNEGSGHTVSEWSGLGGGAKEYSDPNSTNIPPVESWDTGWTSGAPISAKD
jgi:hypothetical protein